MFYLDVLYRYKVPDIKKLLSYGFEKQGDLYIYETPIMDKQFYLRITVDKGGDVGYKVFEDASGDEYVLVNVESANGGFVSKMRDECEAALSLVAEKCFDTEVLSAEQTKRIINAISSLYGAKPEFLWENHPDCAAFRRKDNSKWFAIIMTVDRSKIGLSGHGNIEIIDMKAEPEAVAELLKSGSFYPAYHMNKKHWFTSVLDGSVKDETLLALLSNAYRLSAKNKANSLNRQ